MWIATQHVAEVAEARVRTALAAFWPIYPLPDFRTRRISANPTIGWRRRVNTETGWIMERSAHQEGAPNPQATVRRAGCIEHREHERLSICREDYLAICDGNQAAAHLLNAFEFWHNVRLTEVEQERVRSTYQPGYRPNLSMVVYKSYKDLKTDLLGEYSEDKLREGTRLLIEKGFVVTPERTPNPWNRTRAYRFQPEAVQAALRDCWKTKGLESHARKIGDGRNQEVPDARESGERPREVGERPGKVVDGNPKTERCSYKSTASGNTGNKTTAIPGQNKHFPFYNQNQNRSERGGAAQNRRDTCYDDDPEFNQIESTYWNTCPESDDPEPEY